MVMGGLIFNTMLFSSVLFMGFLLDAYSGATFIILLLTYWFCDTL